MFFTFVLAVATLYVFFYSLLLLITIVLPQPLARIPLLAYAVCLAFIMHRIAIG